MNIQCDGSSHAKCNNANTDGRVNMDIHESDAPEAMDANDGLASPSTAKASRVASTPPRGCGT